MAAKADKIGVRIALLSDRAKAVPGDAVPSGVPAKVIRPPGPIGGEARHAESAITEE